MPTIYIDSTGERFEQTEQHDCMLRAGLNAGLGLAYECNSGGCGSCKFELLEGEVEVLWAEAPALTERDIKKGRKLACQCRAKTDLVVKMRTDPRYLPGPVPGRFLATLQARHEITADITEFRFRGPQPARFLPGQYAMLSLEDGLGPRAYSMSNLPNEDGIWEFWIRRKPGGQVSEGLFARLRPGDRAWLDGPYGLAYLRSEVPRDVLCIAGGSGISPMLSIARAVATSPAMADRKVHFFFGGRTPEDLCGITELQALPDFAERLDHCPAISMPESSPGWDGAVGFIHDIAQARLGERLPQFECYLAGPPPMVQATARMLQVSQVPPGQIHYDPFY